MPIRRPAQRRSIASLLAVAMLLVACNPPVPTASPTTVPVTPLPPTPGASQPPAADVYAAIRQAVETIRGLRPTADVGPVTIDAAQLRTNLTAEFDAENSAADLKFSEQELITLGFLPAGASLRDITLDFQSGSVAGYYSPDKKELYVVSRSGGVGAAERVTYSHEFTHQLDDQNFPLLGLLGDTANESDGSLAALGLIEGDAVSVQTTWTLQTLTPQELGELLQASLDPAALEALRRAPAYLRETSLFPYQDGNNFVQSLLATGGYAAVDDALGKPPVSTEQILHPEKYASGEKPKVVKIPNLFDPSLPPGWKALGQDTLGEFILRVWLVQGGVPTVAAATAAAGWGGDRLELYESPGGHSLLLVTEWDTQADAAEFATSAKTALAGLALSGSVVFDERSPIVYLAIGDDAPVIEPRIFD